MLELLPALSQPLSWWAPEALGGGGGNRQSLMKMRIGWNGSERTMCCLVGGGGGDEDSVVYRQGLEGLAPTTAPSGASSHSRPSLLEDFHWGDVTVPWMWGSRLFR